MHPRTRLVALVCLLALVACDSPDPDTDAGAVSDGGEGTDAGPRPDGAVDDDAGQDSTPPTPSGTPPTVEEGDGSTVIGFEEPSDSDYAGALVVRVFGTDRSTELPPRGAPQSVGATIGAGEVVAVLAAGTTSYEDTESEGDVCWSIFGFDGAFNYVDLGGGCRAGVDVTAPGALAGFVAMGRGEWNELLWDMAPADVVRVRIVHGDVAPGGPEDGTELCDPCAGERAEHVGLAPGASQHYAAFAFDAAGNRSEAARGEATVGGVVRTFENQSLPSLNLSACSVAADGTEFAVGREGVVLIRAPGGRWAELPRPPTTSTILDVWAFSASDVWLTGASGNSVFHWDGSSYAEVATTSLFAVTSFWGNSANDLYAGGNAGSVDHWDGSGWSHIADFNTIGDDQQIRGIFSLGPDRIFAGGSDGDIYTFSAGSWSILDAGVTVVHGFWGATDDDVWVAGGSGGMGRRFDGTSWVQVPGSFSGGAGIDGASANEIRIVNGRSVFSYDGTSWTEVLMPGTASGRDICHAGGGEWIVVGDGGSIRRLSAGGSWELEVGGANSALLAISGAPDDSFAAAAGHDDTVLQRTSGGFTPVQGGSTSRMFDVHVAAADAAVAGGQSGAVSIWDGTAWSRRTESMIAPASIRSVWTVSASEYWMLSGNVVHRTATGATTYSDLGFTGSRNTIFGFSNADIWIGGGAAGPDGGAVSRFDGTDWVATTGLCDRIEDLHGLAPDDVWVVGDAGCVSHFDGTGWTTIAAGTTEDLRAVWAADRRNVYVGGDNATLLHWDGSAFEALTVETTGNVTGIWATSAENVWLAGTEGAWIRRGSL